MMNGNRLISGVLVAAGISLAIVACSDSGGSTPNGGQDAGPDGVTVLPDGAVIGPDGEVLNDASPQQDGDKPIPGSSCAGLPATCGGNKDCCSANVVPGGTFNRSNDPSYPATVSTFKLDVYEVTVGRFRNFVNAGKGTQANPPAVGAGANPKIPGSGWDAAFNTHLAANTDELKAGLKCRVDYPAWSDTPGGNETKPINCVTWYDALAFCAWDGGWLPTETEWNYAAAGGSEQRDYPFGATIDVTQASYDCRGDGSGVGACAFSDMLPVGSKSPAGDGRWGHADLAGNVWEWTLDYSRSPYRLTTCVDCADLQGGVPNRTFRGGGFPNESFYQTTATRLEDTPLDRDYDVGFRCARTP
jgi:formylglycine-generating enzyme required for sulfatase activity